MSAAFGFARSLFFFVSWKSTLVGLLLAGLLGLIPNAGKQALSQTTTISGTVYMPNGTVPLPNVLVYVTNQLYNPRDEGRIAYNDPSI